MPNKGYTLQSGTSNETSQYLVTNNKNYNNFKYWITGIDVTSQNLDQMNPYIRGISRLFFYKTPYFMEKMFEDLTKNFKSYIETGFKSVSGIADLNMSFVDFEGGFSGQKFSNASLSRDDTDTITVSLYEMSGSPVREFIETWITGVRDPRSGVAHYHGGMDDLDIPYGEKYHTGEFIYMDLDPTAKKIEYACMLAHAMPTKVPKDHLNYESGNRDNVQMDLEFNVTKYESRYINDVAAFYLACDTIKYSYLDFNPNISSKNVQDAYALSKDT